MSTRINKPEMHLYHKMVTHWLLKLVQLVSTGEVCFVSQDLVLSEDRWGKKEFF